MDRLATGLLVMCVTTLVLSALAVANADSFLDEQAAICRDWRELTSPWPGLSCFEHGGFALCEPVKPGVECKP